MSDDEEILDVLDDAGNVTGQKPRCLVHRDHDRHGLVFVWSAWKLDGRSVMLLQRRARSGDPFAAHADALAGGHITAGETALDAAQRELMEEVGATADAEQFVMLGSSHMDRPTRRCRRIVQYLLLYPIPLDLMKLEFSAEVDGFYEVDLKDFAALVLGKRASIAARARLAGRDDVHDIELPRSAVSDYPDAILDTFRRSLASIIGWLEDGQVDPAHFSGDSSTTSGSQ
jgi:8-oxo-dGTP pyrophosphatase MutT (NUDIX family)